MFWKLYNFMFFQINWWCGVAIACQSSNHFFLSLEPRKIINSWCYINLLKSFSTCLKRAGSKRWIQSAELQLYYDAEISPTKPNLECRIWLKVVLSRGLRTPCPRPGYACAQSTEWGGPYCLYWQKVCCRGWCICLIKGDPDRHSWKMDSPRSSVGAVTVKLCLLCV